jgi:hypothetical protein
MKTARSDSEASRTLSPANDVHGELLDLRRVHIIAISSLCAIGALVYGIFIRSVGFYWDDWPVIWVYNALGAQGIKRYFAGNRPASGWIYAKLAPLLGISPVGWQAVNVGIRCIASVILYFLFCTLWPRRKDVAWIVAVLVLLYPGFTQQAIALTYLSQNLSFLLFVASLLLTVFALARPRYRWLFLLLSLASGVGSYLITEYFVGLEFVRLVIIGVFREGEVDRKKLREALFQWSPYAVAWAAYMVWRSFIFHEVHYGPIGDKNVGYLLSTMLRSPVRELGGLVRNGMHNITMSAVYAFLRPFMAGAIGGIRSWVIASVVVGISLYTLRRLTTCDKPAGMPETSLEMSRGFLWDGAAISIVGLCFGGLPFVSGQTVFFASSLSFGDRFTLPFMLPACVAFACFLSWGLTGRRSKAIVVGLVLFAFSAFQVQCMNSYRHDWLAQKSLFWQLAWRLPSVKPGTTIFVDGLPDSVASGETAGLLDLLYKRDDRTGKLDYFMYDLQRFPEGKPSYRPSTPITRRLRSFQFLGTTSQSAVSWLSPNGTLRVIAPSTAGEIVQGPLLCASIADVSHPEEIITATQGVPDGPLLKLFGLEAKHDWQYFYQRAELERQLKHWDAVALLGDDAVKEGYGPTDESEWFPFIDGYAHAHRYRTAAELTERMLKESPEAISALSSLWLNCSHECSPNSEELSETLRRLGNKLMLPAPQ